MSSRTTSWVDVHWQQCCAAAISALCGWLILLGCAAHAADFPPPETVFKYSARIEDRVLIVNWQIAPGYYLYQQRMSIQTQTPGAQLGTPQWPTGETYRDKFFGDQTIYRREVAVRVPVTFAAARPQRLDLKLKLQGCAEAGFCYPPAVWAAHVDLPAETSRSLRSLFNVAPRGANDFLPPDEAFRFNAEVEDAGTVKLEWVIAQGYYLYKDHLRLDSNSPSIQLGAPKLPQGKLKHDENFGDTEVYYETCAARVPLKVAGAARELNLTVTYQGCAEAGLCYNPIVKKVALQLPAARAQPSHGQK